jgi:hypothetical protein
VRLTTLAAGVVLITVAACADSADAPTGEKEPSLTQPGTSARDLPSESGPLDPGTHASAEFITPATFRLEDGWSLAEDSPGIIHLYRGSEAPANCLCLLAPDAVYDPDTGVPEPPPEDYVAWLEAHPFLETSNPSSLQVGNVAGQQMEISLLQDASPVPLFAAGETMFTLGPGDRAHIIVLDYSGTPVIVAARAPAAEFAEFFAAVEPVVGSLSLG